MRTRRGVGRVMGAAALLLATACGSDDETSTTDTQATTASSSSSAPVATAADTTAETTPETTPDTVGSTPDTAAEGEALDIAVLSPDYSAQPAAKEAVDAFVAEADAAGHETTVVDTNSDNAAMNAEITGAVSQGVDAIVVAFGTPREFGEGLADAAEAEIPVFGLDTGGVTDEILVNVTTDPAVLGEQSAQAIIDELDGEGQIAMITFDAFEPVGLRGQAAQKLFEDAGIEVIEYIQGDPADSTGFAKATVGDLLSKYAEGELDAVWSGWDATALGAYQATQDAGRTEVLITGVDGQDFAKAEVAKGGNWIATVRQDWPTVAKTEMELIDAYFSGTEPADQVVYVPAILITADNAN